MDEVRRLLALAWPVVLAQLGMMAMGVVDLLVVAPLGRDATAAVGIGNTVSFGTLILGLGAANGLDPLVAQAFGAGRPRTAGTEAARGLVLVLLLAVPITLVHLGAGPLLTALGQPATVVPLATAYLVWLAPGVSAALVFQVVRQLLQGGGSMRPAMWVMVLANVANLALDVLFVRAMGVAGAGLATTLVRFTMVAALVAISWSELRHARPDGAVFDLEGILRVGRIAMPVSFQIGLEVWAFNTGYIVAGLLGAAEQAAHTAAMSAASLSFMVPLGISAAAATRVGNLVGAGQDWRRAAWASVAIGAVAMAFPAMVFLSVPDAIGAIYNRDADVVAIAAAVLPIAALFQFFDGVQVVAFGVLRGLGDTRRPALFNVVGYWVIGLPLGAWLALRRASGLTGMWIGFTVALIVVATLLVARLAFHSRAAHRPAAA